MTTFIKDTRAILNREMIKFVLSANQKTTIPNSTTGAVMNSNNLTAEENLFSLLAKEDDQNTSKYKTIKFMVNNTEYKYESFQIKLISILLYSLDSFQLNQIIIIIQNKNKIMQEHQIQNIKSHYLYNMLQDFRHLVVFDLRSSQQFDQKNIRDSFSLNQETKISQIQHVIELALRKADQKQKKYKDLKKIRRYIFVDEKTFQNNSSCHAKQITKVLQRIPKDATNKFYGLSENLHNFYEEYPFLFLEKAKFDEEKAKGATQQQLQKLLLYPYCKFPTELIPGKLYIGNIYSSNSEKQLKDLGIKNLIDFIDYESIEIDSQKMIPTFKSDTDKYNYLSIPFNKDVQVKIDFDKVNSEICKKLDQGKTLLYCRDGQTISAALAISLLMYKANLDITMASVKVCQAIGRTDITKWVYTQLLVYKPKK